MWWNRSCKYCTGHKSSLYLESKYLDIEFNLVNDAKAIYVTSKNMCPSTANCGFKNTPIRGLFLVNYCPHCGRNLNKKRKFSLFNRTNNK